MLMEEPKRNQKFAKLVLRLMDETNQTTMASRAHVTGGSLSKIRLAQTQPSWVLTYRLALAYPEWARELFEAAEYPLPAELIPGVTEAAARLGLPAERVVEDAVRRLMEGAGPSE